MKDIAHSLKARLDPILALLHKHQIVESLAQRSPEAKVALVEQLLHRQHEEELRRKLALLKGADIAHLLEMLPLERRALVWDLTDDFKAAESLLEVNEGTRAHLVEHTRPERLQGILAELEADDLPIVAPFLSASLLREAKARLETSDRHWLETALTFEEDSVGSLMTRDSLLLNEALTVDQAIADIRQLPGLPEQTDKAFIVHGQRTLVGVLPLTELLRHEGERRLDEVMDPMVVKFRPEDEAEEAAYTFERYDLICAPVVDERDRIIGRLTVDRVMDYLRERNEERGLAKQGLSARADLFGPLWVNARSRWLWLAINLVTAFLATRFIAVFEDTIGHLVALAALMPIVASLGGNTGQQTAALMIRSLSLDQIQGGNLGVALRRELSVSLVNGGLWGGVIGLVAAALYGSIGLGLVMTAAVLLNLLIAAVTGILVPFLIDRLGRDPAMGTSVILTFVTDSMGFFLFLGLATLWLV